MEEVILHEAYGHYGARMLFGKGLEWAMSRLYMKLGGKAGVKKLAERHGIDLDLYFRTASNKGKTGAWSKERQAFYLADELLAHMQGKRATESLPERIVRAVREFIGAVRNILRKIGFAELSKVSDADLAFLLRRMAEAAEGGGKYVSGALPMFMRKDDTKEAYERRIDELFAGKPANRVGVRVLDRSDVLDMLGCGDSPVYLNEGEVIEGRFNHRLTAEHWKRVPEWLENPAAVFDSDTVKGRLVVFAPDVVNGAPVRIIIQPNSEMHGLGAHVLVNAYDERGGKAPIFRWPNDGLLRYYGKDKSRALQAGAGLQLSRAYEQARGSQKSIHRARPCQVPRRKPRRNRRKTKR